jgi:hypothetical protein
MQQSELIKVFSQLGEVLRNVGNEKWPGNKIGLTEKEFTDFQFVIQRQAVLNPWFAHQNVIKACNEWGNLLTQENLTNFCAPYTFAKHKNKIGVIMAGNIPLVGFHDFLCVLISGHHAVCKLSSDDNTLLPAIASLLSLFEPRIADRISFPAGSILPVDAVIATGSNNSMLHFEQYFKQYPHIFRNNRTSIAVLTGKESNEEIELLGNDIFDYFGRGCRNVTHLLLPNGYDFAQFFGNIIHKGECIHHNKYANNYDYNRATFLLNMIPVLDNHFVLLRETDDIHSPLAVLHYHYYSTESDIVEYIERNKSSIQAVVGAGYIPFGGAQTPALTDFADQLNTMEFLSNLSA